MTEAFDAQAISDMTVAINCEMSPSGRPHRDSDTLFMSGTRPTEADEDALGRFACSKNYKIVYPAYDASGGRHLPTTFTSRSPTVWRRRSS